jgi:hypothetical protein
MACLAGWLSADPRQQGAAYPALAAGGAAGADRGRLQRGDLSAEATVVLRRMAERVVERSGTNQVIPISVGAA